MKLAVVEWADAQGSNVWQEIPQDMVPKVPTVNSVGWVLGRDKEGIYLVSTWSGNQAGQTMVIPAGMIKKVTYVGTKYTIR